MSTSHDNITARLELALEAGKEAGKLTVDYFRQGVTAERKSDDSPVTIADRQAELHLRQRISTAFPEDGIVGEEFGIVEGTSGVRWILDPIDGTKSFITGVPLYGTMVGVEVAGRAEIGFVYIAALDEGIYAARGRGAWHFVGSASPQRAQVSSSKSLREGAFLTSQVDTFAKRGAAEVYRQLEKAAYITRTWGDCYGYMLVATGRALVMVDPIMNVWDAAAIQPIMEEAGGTFTDWHGKPTIHAGEGIGTNGHVLQEVLAMTKPHSA
jgi:histidinol phosphatase-like enzyme (inositol monophosphatase family)